MNYPNARRVGAFVFVVYAALFSFRGHALNYYTDAAACLASLTSVGRQIHETGGVERLDTVDLNAPREMPTLNELRDLTRERLASGNVSAEDRREFARIQGDVERIAAHPNYRTARGFAVTDVIRGREAILAYADRLASRAADLTRGQLERTGRGYFNVRRLLARTAIPLAGIGLYGALANYLIQQPEISTPAFAGFFVASGAIGVLVGFQIPELYTRWRAYFNPALRADWLLIRDRQPLSAHFQTFRAVLKGHDVAREVSAKLGTEYRPRAVFNEFALDTRLDTSDADRLLEAFPDQAAIEVLTTGKDGPDTRLSIENIMYIDPDTDEAYAIVHVRGAHLPQPEWAVVP